jgi:hypothetical protein
VQLGNDAFIAETSLVSAAFDDVALSLPVRLASA